MKRLLGIGIFILGIVSLGQAQVHPHAIGLRLGGNGNTNGAELSYQYGLSNINRLEFDLGFGSNKNFRKTYLSGIYQWDWNITQGLNWFVGPGVSIGHYKYDYTDVQINFAIGGQIGLEYDFNNKNVPLLLSLDARPMWDLIGDNAGLGWGAALGIRVTF